MINSEYDILLLENTPLKIQNVDVYNYENERINLHVNVRNAGKN